MAIGVLVITSVAASLGAHCVKNRSDVNANVENSAFLKFFIDDIFIFYLSLLQPLGYLCVRLGLVIEHI